jgi:predicted transcriptional regulator
MANDDEFPPKVDVDDVAPDQRIKFMDDNIRVFTRPKPAGYPTIQTEEQILAALKPRDWLVRNIIERGYVYSLTGPTGSGKTAVALLISYAMANDDMPKSLGRLEVEAGRVVFLAGENPADVGPRMKAMRVANYLISPSRFGVVSQIFSIAEHLANVRIEIEMHGPADLIVVDTAAAFATANAVTEENSNIEMGNYAQMLRKLTTLPGNPAVLVLCHPAKAVTTDREAMVPRGGSGFLAEVDGNLALLPVTKGVVELTHTSKLRGPGFEPITIELLPVTDPAFDDLKGRQNWSVVARVMQEFEIAEKEDAELSDREKVVAALRFAGEDGMRQAQIVETTGINKGNLSRIIRDMKLDKLITEGELDKRRLVLTEKGKKVASKTT